MGAQTKMISSPRRLPRLLDAERVALPPADQRPALLRWLLSHGVQPLLVAVDALALVIAGVLASAPPSAIALMTVVVLVLYKHAALYRSRLTLSLLDDLPSLVGGMLIAGALVTSGSTVIGRTPERAVLAAAALAAVVVTALRAVSYLAVTWLRSRGNVAHRTLILGAGNVGGRLADLMLEHPSAGLKPIGFLDDDPLLTAGQRMLPLLGAQRDLAQVMVEYRVKVVIIAFSSLRESDIIQVIRTCDRLHGEILYVPRLFELQHNGPEMDQLRGLPLIRLRRAAFRTLSWRLKRPFDIAFSLGALVLLAPVLAAIALAVRLEGGPGVLFRQDRVGLDGRIFRLLKFRSLRPLSDNESQTTWSIVDDERLGPVGRCLRRTSLDELPQLINVLRGDMSLVGPRPERPHFVSTFALALPRYPDRHRVPTGVTGWAQVHGLRGDTSIPERADFDNYYIENWSVWNDVKIVLRTIGAVVRREGA